MNKYYLWHEKLLFEDIAAAYRDAVKAFYDAGCRYLQFDDTSWGELEDPEAVKARIKEASEYVPLEQLCISPQCGFSSTEEGNILAAEDQWKKVALLKQIAEDVWGE